MSLFQRTLPRASFASLSQKRREFGQFSGSVHGLLCQEREGSYAFSWRLAAGDWRLAAVGSKSPRPAAQTIRKQRLQACLPFGIEPDGIETAAVVEVDRAQQVTTAAVLIACEALRPVAQRLARAAAESAELGRSLDRGEWPGA